MAYGTLAYHDYVSDLTNYAIYMEARLGDNGDLNGLPELAMGHDGSDATFGDITWDGDLSDGFDTSTVPVGLTATMSGGTIASSGTIDNQPLTYSTSGSATFKKVQIRAFTLAAAAVEWSGVTVTFFYKGRAVDSYSSGTGPSVDMENATGTIHSESILEVTTSVPYVDKVRVSGAFDMFYDSTTISPGGTDLAGQIFIY